MGFICNMLNRLVLLELKERLIIMIQEWRVILFSVKGEDRARNPLKFMSTFRNWFQMGIICRYLGVEII